jgi:6-hydroxycyclohex-1-ene-1-carbonyl-CoA dehydrogenase
LPEHYPAALDLVLDGKIAVEPFVERHPMSAINRVLESLHKHELSRRPVLIPDFGNMA